MRHLPLLFCIVLTGCCWWSDAPLPAPATNDHLSGAESNLDHLTDKRDSRVAAAVTVAGEKAEDSVVKGELDVAKAMLPPPTAEDLKWAQDRAAKGDDAFYLEQIKVSRQLAAALIKANADYEQAKAKKQAEYEARLKEKEMALAAEIESRQADKWTYAGIALTTIGLIALFVSPMKLAAVGVALAGLVVGAMPVLLRQPWFGYAQGGLLGVIGIAAIYFITRRRKPAPSSDGSQA